jgi:transcription elongation GreA/GreB family factor
MINAIIKKLSLELEIAIAASQRAHQTATDKQNIPDNKYDTLALEAAYLAHGQSLRIAELQNDLFSYQNFKPPLFNSDSEIALGASVTLQDQHGKTKLYYMGPCAGGLRVYDKHITLQVLTPQAPLGKLILGKFLGDVVEIHLSVIKQNYLIVDVA